MFSKSVFKKYSEQLEKSKSNGKAESIDRDPTMRYVSIGLRPNSKHTIILKFDGLIDTGCGFLLSLPLSMSSKLKGFERVSEHDSVGIGVGDKEIQQIAVKANIIIAGVEFECICHFTDGIDEPILGMPLFLEHLDLSISNGVVKIVPTRKS